MERDFLGFSSKNGVRNTMKVDEGNKTRDPVMGSGMQWGFSNKVSALPHFLSFKTTQEERSRNTTTISDPLASSGYMTISTKDAFDSNQKPFLGITQKNLTISKQAGNNHGMKVHPLQCSDSQSACLQEPRKISVSNQSNQVSPVLQSNLASTGLSMVNSVIKPQPLSSKSSAAPVFPSSIGSIVGSTDLRNCSKSSGTPAQLTIFYGGSVCVYDDISPEKAKAVMLMAGNRSSANQNMAVSKAKLQTEISAPSKNNGFIISQSFPSSSPLPNPLPVLPVTSHASSHPRGGSSGNNELPMIRSAGPSTAPNNHSGSAATKMIQPGGLPQARKASLARFLEKRKERVISTLPYYKCNKASPECSTPGSDSIGFSMDFSGSCSLPASN